MTHYFAVLKIATPQSYDYSPTPHTVILESINKKDLDAKVSQYGNVASVEMYEANLIEYKETQ